MSAECLLVYVCVCACQRGGERSILRPLCQIVFFSDLSVVNKDGLICSLKTVLCKAFSPGVCIIFTVSTLQTQGQANAMTMSKDCSHAQVNS